MYDQGSGVWTVVSKDVDDDDDNQHYHHQFSVVSSFSLSLSDFHCFPLSLSHSLSRALSAPFSLVLLGSIVYLPVYNLPTRCPCKKGFRVKLFPRCFASHGTFGFFDKFFF